MSILEFTVGDVCLVGHGCRATDSIHRRMLLLLAIFEILSIDNDHREHAGQSLFEDIVRECNRLSSSYFHFEAKHLLTSWKTILQPDDSPSDTTENQQIRLSKKKLIIIKAAEPAATQSNINWKQFIPSLELLHNDQLWIDHRHQFTFFFGRNPSIQPENLNRRPTFINCALPPSAISTRP